MPLCWPTCVLSSQFLIHLVQIFVIYSPYGVLSLPLLSSSFTSLFQPIFFLTKIYISAIVSVFSSILLSFIQHFYSLCHLCLCFTVCIMHLFIQVLCFWVYSLFFDIVLHFLMNPNLQRDNRIKIKSAFLFQHFMRGSIHPSSETH